MGEQGDLIRTGIESDNKGKKKKEKSVFISPLFSVWKQRRISVLHIVCDTRNVMGYNSVPTRPHVKDIKVSVYMHHTDLHQYKHVHTHTPLSLSLGHV